MKIICENPDGDQLAFAFDGFPLLLTDTDGLDMVKYDVKTTQNSGQDGETYNGATAEKRNIVLTAEILANYQQQRDRLYNFFQPRTRGIIYWINDEENGSRKAYYYAEYVLVAEAGVSRTASISLICPDPKWYALTDQLTDLAVWKGLIEFPLELSPSFEVTSKVNTLIGNVHNDSAVPLGLTIRFAASGDVSNPSLYDVNRQELLQINTTMRAGDVITVTTADGNKRVQLTSGGTSTNINNLMIYPPIWLKAYQGDNLFRYNADSGIDSLSVSILSTQAYWGA